MTGRSNMDPLDSLWLKDGNLICKRQIRDFLVIQRLYYDFLVNETYKLQL